MNIYIHPVALVFLVSTLASLITSLVIWRYRIARGAKSLLITTISIFFWSGTNALQWVVDDLWLARLFLDISYIGIYGQVIGFVLFAFDFSRHGSKLRQKYIIPLIGISAAALAIIYTNDFHQLIRSNLHFAFRGNIRLVLFEIGPLHNTVVYLLPLIYCLAAIWLLFRSVLSSKGIKKRQLRWILATLFFPWLAAGIQIHNIDIPFGIDISSIAFSVTSILLTIAILRYEVLDVTFVARNTLIDNLTDGIIVLDNKNRVIDINPAARNDMGVEDRQIIGLGAKDVFPPQVWDIIHDKTDTRLEVNVHGKNAGHYFDVLIDPIYRTYRDLNAPDDKPEEEPDEDEVLGRMIIYRDITERKVLEDALKQKNSELKEANALKDRFFSIIAHDLRAPYISILGYGEMLKDGMRTMPREELEEMSQKIINAGISGSALLENLLEWARSQTGTYKYKARDFDLAGLVTESLGHYKLFAESKNIQITLEDNYKGMVHADRDTIGTIVRNLLANAIKFSFPGGKIRLEMRQVDTHVRVLVNDEGIGMSPEDTASVFSLDSKVKQNGTNGERGTGLGLLLCREYAEKNGGSITVISTPDKGSTFSFTVPIKKPDRPLTSTRS